MTLGNAAQFFLTISLIALVVWAASGIAQWGAREQPIKRLLVRLLERFS